MSDPPTFATVPKNYYTEAVTPQPFPDEESTNRSDNVILPQNLRPEFQTTSDDLLATTAVSITAPEEDIEEFDMGTIIEPTDTTARLQDEIIIVGTTSSSLVTKVASDSYVTTGTESIETTMYPIEVHASTPQPINGKVVNNFNGVDIVIPDSMLPIETIAPPIDETTAVADIPEIKPTRPTRPKRPTRPNVPPKEDEEFLKFFNGENTDEVETIDIQLIPTVESGTEEIATTVAYEYVTSYTTGAENRQEVTEAFLEETTKSEVVEFERIDGDEEEETNLAKEEINYTTASYGGTSAPATATGTEDNFFYPTVTLAEGIPTEPTDSTDLLKPTKATSKFSKTFKF